MQLHPYQEEALTAIEAGWARLPKNKNQLLVLATSLGKTVCFSTLTKRELDAGTRRVLILAHREELLEQAQDTLQRVTQASCGWEQAERYATLEDSIVLGSVASLGRAVDSEYSDRLRRFPRDHFGLIIIDEAHHATSATYGKVLSYFNSAKVLGVTATPKRGKNESLTSVFSHVPYQLGLVEASARQLLSPIKIHRVSSKTDLRGLRTTAGDYNLGDLAERVNNEERNELILQTYLGKFKDRQAIIYATDLAHARELSKNFKKNKIPTESITGDMDKSQRRQFLQDFREGKIKVLTNFGVLTEGFDHRSLDLIISARPTQSALLLTQILGRGLRLFEGKTHCDFVEMVDLHSGLTATCASLFGFENTFDSQGVFIAEAMSDAQKLSKAKPYFNAWNHESYNQMRVAFDLAEDPEIVRLRVLEHQKQYQLKQQMLSAARRLAYQHELEKERQERVEWENRNTLIKRYRWTKIGDSYRIKHVDKTMGELALSCSPNPLGGFEGQLVNRTNGELKLELSAETLEETLDLLEGKVAADFRQVDNLLNESAEWKIRGRDEPCTDPQWKFISGQRMTHLSREQISKTEASDIISKWKSRN